MWPLGRRARRDLSGGAWLRWISGSGFAVEDYAFLAVVVRGIGVVGVRGEVGVLWGEGCWRWIGVRGLERDSEVVAWESRVFITSIWVCTAAGLMYVA